MSDPTTKFQQRHYVAVAGILKGAKGLIVNAGERDSAAEFMRRKLVIDFARMFRRDSSKFDLMRFCDACDCPFEDET